MAGIVELVKVERDWVPDQPGTSLYVRPVLMAVNPDLALHGPAHCLFFIICSPVGSYYAGGLQCNAIRVEEQDVRAVRGGTGFAKCGGNYAGSMLAGERAAEKGYDQVLWLDGKEHKYVEEVGSMNMMFVIDGTIVTAPLDGTILPGVTRDSILTLAKDAGWKTEERKISIDEVYQAAREGRLDEAFGTGTAAVVSPVGRLCYKGEEIVIHNGKIGPKAAYLYDRLLNIQLGNYEDKFGWVTVCK